MAPRQTINTSDAVWSTVTVPDDLMALVKSLPAQVIIQTTADETYSYDSTTTTWTKGRYADERHPTVQANAYKVYFAGVAPEVKRWNRRAAAKALRFQSPRSFDRAWKRHRSQLIKAAAATAAAAAAAAQAEAEAPKPEADAS